MENPATIFFFAAMVNRFVEGPVIPLEKASFLWNYGISEEDTDENPWRAVFRS